MSSGTSPIFLTALFVYYIFIGSASILAVKFSEEGGKEKLSYNTAVAVFFIEFFKLVAAILFDRLGYCGSSSESKRSTTLANWARYGGPALLYAVCNNLAFVAITLLGPAMFSLFVNSKILFAAVAGALLLKQKFTTIQWLGLVNLVFALIVSKVRMLGGSDCPAKALLRNLVSSSIEDANGSAAEPQPLVDDSILFADHSFQSAHFGQIAVDGIQKVISSFGGSAFFSPMMALQASSADEIMESSGASARSLQEGAAKATGEAARTGVASPAEQFGAFFLGFICVMIMSVGSGLSGAVNEWLLKAVDSDVPLMRKNAWGYQWGCLLNFVGIIFFQSGKDNPMMGVFDGFSIKVWLIVFVNVALGLTVSLVLKYLDNVIKCIGGVMIIFVCALASAVLFDQPCTPEFLVAACIFGISSYLYIGAHNKVLLAAQQAEEDKAEQQTGKDYLYGTPSRHEDEQMLVVDVDKAELPDDTAPFKDDGSLKIFGRREGGL
ncbi:unnamed protein product [Amoebophrya sp. A25]|nr:unnamed protein product [Amoebophrya sp. A25]|eukprot:GSA25T00003012001.1